MKAVLESGAPPRAADREHGPEGSHELRWRLALAGVMLVGCVVLLRAGRETGFWFDEWNFVFGRRDWTADALLAPHNEHLSLVPVLAYKLGFATFGLDSYLPYRLVALALHLTCVGLLFAYVRVRVGPALALAAAAVLAVPGLGAQDVLWAFQIGYLGSLAAGLGALVALDRRTRRGDIVAAVLLTAALASSSLGIPLWIAAAVDVLTDPERRRRWPVVAIPLVLYALWYLGYGVSQGIKKDNLLEAPAYVADAAAAAAGALFGLSPEWGRPLVLAIALAVAWRLLSVTGRPWRLVVLIVLPLAFWGLTAVARADLGEPGAPRYLYPGVLFLLLLLAEAGAGLRASRRALVLAGVLVAGIVVANTDAALKAGAFLRDRHAGLDGGLAAVALAGPSVPAGFAPAPGDSPQVTVAGYRALGADAPAPPSPAGASPKARHAADAALIRLGSLSVRPGGGPAGAPSVEEADPGVRARPGACLTVTGSGALVVPVGAGGLSVRALGGDVQVAPRRFGDTVQDPLPAIAAGTTSTLVPRADGSRTPWRVQLTIGGEARVCGA